MSILCISDPEYRDLPQLNQSLAKRLLVSAKYFREAEAYDTSYFRLGSLVDCMVLTPQLLEDRFCCRPDFANHPSNVDAKGNASSSPRTKWCLDQSEQFADTVAGRTVVAAGDWDIACRLAGMCHSKPWLRNHLSLASVQVVLTGEIRGVPAKAMADGIGPGFLFDLKTTRDAGEKFLYDFRKFGYDFQFAWYQELAEQNGLRVGMDQCYVIAAQKTPPLDVVCYHIPQWILEQGREKVDIAMIRYKRAMADEDWPGMDHGQEVVELGLRHEEAEVVI
jgi:hypothetical protein